MQTKKATTRPVDNTGATPSRGGGRVTKRAATEKQHRHRRNGAGDDSPAKRTGNPFTLTLPPPRISAYEMEAAFGNEKSASFVIEHFETYAQVEPQDDDTMRTRLQRCFQVFARLKKDMEYMLLIPEDDDDDDDEDDDDDDDDDEGSIPFSLTKAPHVAVFNEVGGHNMDLYWLRQIMFRNHALFRYCFYAAQRLINIGVALEDAYDRDEYIAGEQANEQIAHNISEMTKHPQDSNVELQRENEHIRDSVYHYIKGRDRWWIEKLTGDIHSPVLHGPILVKGVFEANCYDWATEAIDISWTGVRVEETYTDSDTRSMLNIDDGDYCDPFDTYRFFWNTKHNWVSGNLQSDVESVQQQLSVFPAISILTLDKGIEGTLTCDAAKMDRLSEILNWRLTP